MLYLDLDELPSLVRRDGPIADRKFASRSFLRQDHLHDNSQSLANEVRQIVQQQTGRITNGKIRLLTQLRYFGYYFSPLNLFYIHDDVDQHVEYVVAEVSNTPWRERHCYVLWEGNRTGVTDALKYAHPKRFHVSPFMGMDMQYQWRLTEPGPRLQVHLANSQNSKRLFDAAMTLQRRELTSRQLSRMTLRYPLMTAKIGAAIYYQALKLWWKKCPFYAHPRKLNHSNFPPAASPKQTLKTTNVGR